MLFITLKHGWGFDNYLAETNTGRGLKLPYSFKNYYRFVLPIVILALFIQGYVGVFGK